MDGTLSFFDQDTFLFMCVFNDIIIPGPICYTANSDQFVICKSTWVMEIFRLVSTVFNKLSNKFHFLVSGFNTCHLTKINEWKRHEGV